MRTLSRKLGLAFLTAALTMLGAGAARAATIHVPADQATIQAAINAASDGDTVLVAPGTYYENINFMGKAITVTSSGGPDVTRLDGGATATVVIFNSGEGRGSVLNGFTITNGNSYYNYQTLGLIDYDGGGIYISSASPTVTNNVITQNIACGSGGGIAAENSSALIQANTLSNNSQGGCSGGDGGGIYVAGGAVQIIGNTITNNYWSSGDGGGMALNGAGDALIENNTITGNTATGISPASQGGGIYMINGSSALIIQNVITGNSAGQGGNDAGGQGGGISFLVPYGSVGPTLVNNTIADNQGAGGSGIYASGFDAQAALYNNLIVASPGQPALFCDGANSQAPAVVQSNDAFSSGGNGFEGACAGMAGTDGNLSADPVFLAAGSDFHLQPGSPAIDAGDNSAPSLPSSDFDGNARVADGNQDGIAVVDLGAYEFVPTSDTLSPSSLTFGDQAVGTSSAAQVVTLTNTGSQKLYLSVSIDSEFAQTNDCGSALAPGANCSIEVTFAPTTSGTLSGNLTLRSNALGSPQAVALTGTGLGPAVKLTPASLTFGSQAIGTTSPPQTVTLQNTGNAPLNLSGAITSGDFSLTTDCQPPLDPGASCTFNITFTPTTSGIRGGYLDFTDNAPDSPQTVALSGTGFGTGVTLAPSSVNFGNQKVGTTSVAQTVTLANYSSSIVTISTVNIVTLASVPAGTFWYTNGCSTALAPNTSCAISVYFAPKAAGTWTGQLLVYDDAAGSPQSASLTGNGIEPVAVLSPTSLTYSNQLVGTTSPPQTVTLTNTGSTALPISSIWTSSPFAQTNNCGASVAAGATCTINVTFTPALAGTTSGFLYVTDSSDGAVVVSLNGTAVAPAVSFSTPSLGFGGVAVGATSPAQMVTLFNTGNAPLSISGISTAGDFSQTSTCGASVAAGGSCTISVTFTPSAAGSRSGTLAAADNAPGSPQSVSLTGTGLSPAAALSPPSLAFGDQVVGTASGAPFATLSNTGNSPLYISSITVTGDFAQTNNCGSAVQAGTNCSISVTFTPTAAGARTGALTVASNSPGGPVTAALAGNGVEYAPTFNPTSLVFSNQIVGTKSGGKNVKLTAQGPGPLVISSISVTGDFLESNNCPASLNKGQSCNITINFLPGVAGPAAGAIVVADNGLGSPQAVPLSGNGLDFTLSAAPSSVSVDAGSKATYTVTATALGGSFNNKINFACSGLPAASKCQFSPGGVAPHAGSASSTLTIQTTRQSGTSGTPSGSYPIVIAGTAGALQHSTLVTLVVN